MEAWRRASNAGSFGRVGDRAWLGEGAVQRLEDLERCVAESECAQVSAVVSRGLCDPSRGGSGSWNGEEDSISWPMRFKN